MTSLALARVLAATLRASTHPRATPPMPAALAALSREEREQVADWVRQMEEAFYV